MKKIILIAIIITVAYHKSSYAQDTQQQVTSQLLYSYYSLKDALVKGNADSASLKANEFVKTVNGIDYKLISEGNINVLLKDGGAIANSKDISKQREYFSSLSNNMIAVAKAIKLSDKDVYVQYCPMKKASWLSSDKAIKNPYYGSSMLTCGSVKETIK